MRYFCDICAKRLARKFFMISGVIPNYDMTVKYCKSCCQYVHEKNPNSVPKVEMTEEEFIIYEATIEVHES